MEKDFIINNNIKADVVKVLSDRDDFLGIMPLAEALARAEDEGKDLILVSDSKKDEPLCRIQELDKYKYNLKKKAKANKQQGSELKELRLSPNIDKHDLDNKLNQARKILSGGDKVRFVMKFRGREIAYLKNGQDILASAVESLKDLVKEDSPIKQNGRSLIVELVRK